MAIERVYTELCIGCGTCVESCPADVFRLDAGGGKSIAKYPEDCVACCWCLGECPEKAIVFSPVKRVPLFTSWG